MATRGDNPPAFWILPKTDSGRPFAMSVKRSYESTVIYPRLVLTVLDAFKRYSACYRGLRPGDTESVDIGPILLLKRHVFAVPLYLPGNAEILPRSRAPRMVIFYTALALVAVWFLETWVMGAISMALGLLLNSLLASNFSSSSKLSLEVLYHL